MPDYCLAYGSKENVIKAIEQGIIPPGSMVLTEDSNEFIFYSLDKQLKIYHEKYKFTSKTEAEEWIAKYNCSGQIISIHENDKCTIYVVGYDNQLHPISGGTLNVQNSAKVGQFLRVLEVDANGNIISIEACDVTSSPTFDRDEALDLVIEAGLLTPMADEDNKILVDENGNLFTF